MPELRTENELGSDIETALLDADLFIKYRAPERAIKRLRVALERNPRSIPLRERLREIAATNKQPEEAARQCLALASLHIEREDFDVAYDRLMEAKQLDPRISIAAGLEAVRRARRPATAELAPQPQPQQKPAPQVKFATLGGDLGVISVFDAIQVLENARLSGVLKLNGSRQAGEIFFSDGRIIDAKFGLLVGEAAFRVTVEISDGSFEFEKSREEFPIRIQAVSNTNLILDTLRVLDESRMQEVRE